LSLGPGGFKNLADALGISVYALFCKATRAFNQYKDSNHWLPTKHLPLDIPGANEPRTILVTKANMESFHKPVVKNIIEKIHEQIDNSGDMRNRIRALIVPGGLGRSSYFKQQLREEFDPEDDPMDDNFVRIKVSSILTILTRWSIDIH
jgi:hypothetical protein